MFVADHGRDCKYVLTVEYSIQMRKWWLKVSRETSGIVVTKDL